MAITTAARNKQKRARILKCKRARSKQRYDENVAHREAKKAAARVHSAAVLAAETPGEREARHAYQRDYFKAHQEELQRKKRERRAA